MFLSTVSPTMTTIAIQLQLLHVATVCFEDE